MGKKSSKQAPPPPQNENDAEWQQQQQQQFQTPAPPPGNANEGNTNEDDEDFVMNRKSKVPKKKPVTPAKTVKGKKSRPSSDESNEDEDDAYKHSHKGKPRHSLMSLTNFSPEEQGLQTVNHLRSLHGAPAVEMDMKLRKMAEAWTQHIYNSKEMKATHSKNAKKFGECIYIHPDRDYPIDNIINHWYAEGETYDWEYHNFDAGHAHFTQLIWAATTHIGLGYRTGPKGTVLVMMFKPAGNNIHFFYKYVLPPISGHVGPAHPHAFSHPKPATTTPPKRNSLKKKKSIPKIKKKPQ